MTERLPTSKEDVDRPFVNTLHTSPASFDQQDIHSTSKYSGRRNIDVLDRRRIERNIDLGQLTLDDSKHDGRFTDGATKNTYFSQGSGELRMNEPRQWRLVRARGPWSFSKLTLIISVVGSLLLLTILHAFTTRQTDPSGCIVPWTRPTYIAFKDFDTEHTRFATKYHLYMLRDGSYDEDPKVCWGLFGHKTRSLMGFLR